MSLLQQHHNLIEISEMMLNEIVRIFGINRFEQELFSHLEKCYQMRYIVNAKNFDACNNQMLAWMLLLFLFQQTKAEERIRLNNRFHITVISRDDSSSVNIIIYLCSVKNGSKG